MVQQLFHDGLSNSQIASRLMKTRNAVIGKLHRLKLYRPPGEARHRMVTALKQRHKKAAVAPTPRPSEPKPTCAKDGKRSPPRLPQLTVIPTKSIDKLEMNHCRAIGERPELITLDTLIYCGAETDGGSWCEVHKAQVFRLRNSGGG